MGTHQRLPRTGARSPHGDRVTPESAPDPPIPRGMPVVGLWVYGLPSAILVVGNLMIAVSEANVPDPDEPDDA